MPPVKLKSLFVAATVTIGAVATTSSVLPQAVSAGPPAVSGVAVGLDHACVIKAGRLLCWGRNQYGQLGDGTITERHTPVQVSGLSSVIAIAAGGYHSMALKSDGTVYAWGAGPTNPPAGLNNVITIAAGGFHSLALRADETVVAIPGEPVDDPETVTAFRVLMEPWTSQSNGSARCTVAEG